MFNSNQHLNKNHMRKELSSSMPLLRPLTSVTNKEWCNPQATRANRSRAMLRNSPGSSHPSKVAVMPASERPSLPNLRAVMEVNYSCRGRDRNDKQVMRPIKCYLASSLSTLSSSTSSASYSSSSPAAATSSASLLLLYITVLSPLSSSTSSSSSPSSASSSASW